MKNVVIRNFEHSDVEAFIRLSQSSFAEESLAAGITPEDFDRETRRIFRWKMIPYRLLTALMRVKWEAFVAEVDGQVVGGGMYIGRKNHMTLTNLMVDPAYRRQGIGQALLVRRLERLKERGFPFVTAQVLETNTASLENLRKQDFEVYNQFSVYERILPIPKSHDSPLPLMAVRDITRADKALFMQIEKGTTQPSVLDVNGSAEPQYFRSGWQKLYDRFTGYSRWIKALTVQGETIGYMNAYFHHSQRKGSLLQPMISEEQQQYLPALIHSAGSWLEEAGKEAMILEIPDHRAWIHDELIQNGWTRQYTWLELIRWLDERARKPAEDL